jgi:hypothetical protein
MRASEIPATLALERQARAAARRDGKVLRKCGDDRYLIICPHLHEVRPREGTLSLVEVIAWFEFCRARETIAQILLRDFFRATGASPGLFQAM